MHQVKVSDIDPRFVVEPLQVQSCSQPIIVHASEAGRLLIIDPMAFDSYFGTGFFSTTYHSTCDAAVGFQNSNKLVHFILTQARITVVDG